MLAGRPKIQDAPRYASGRIKRTVEALNAMEQAKQREVKKVALEQPHRRDTSDPESPLHGRPFEHWCFMNKVRTEFIDAGLQYRATYRRWQAAKDSPSHEHLGEGGGGDGPSRETVDGWDRDVKKWEQAMSRDAGPQGFSLAKNLIIFDFEPLPWQRTWIIDALDALGHAQGRRMPRHPFI